MKLRLLTFALLCASLLTAPAGQHPVNIGTAANDHTGDAPRTAFGKLNSDLAELYAALDALDASGLTSGTVPTARLAASLQAIIANSGALNLSGLTLTLPSDVTRLGQTIALGSEVAGILPKANGGTGTVTPGLVAGSNITITGTWPNQSVTGTASSYDPANVAITGGAINGVTIGGTQARVANLQNRFGDNFISGESNTILGVNSISWNVGGGALSYSPEPGVVVAQYILEMRNTTAGGSVTGGARIFAIAGEMNVLDASGNATVISPHDKWAPPDLYETGNDRMERVINIFDGTVTYYNVTRRRIIDHLQSVATFGTAAESQAAWTEIFARQQTNRYDPTRTETIAECELRTGLAIWPGETPEARAAFAALSPAARWDFTQQQEAAKARSAYAAWEARAAETTERGEEVTELPPDFYTAQPPPPFLAQP